MTPKQAQLLAYIQRYIAEHGYSPCYREMAAALGLASVSGIHRLVHALAERGFVTTLPDRERSIRITGRAAV